MLNVTFKISPKTVHARALACLNCFSIFAFPQSTAPAPLRPESWLIILKVITRTLPHYENHTLNFFRLSAIRLHQLLLSLICTQRRSGPMDARKLRSAHQTVLKYSAGALEQLTQQTRQVIAELTALQLSRQLRQKGAE